MEKSCLRCGRCCFEPFYRNVRLEDLEDWKAQGRMDLVRIYNRERDRATHKNPRLAPRGLPLHSCRFLEPDGKGRFICSIYPFRPRTCRKFKPGSSKICPQYQGKKKPGHQTLT